MTTALAAKPAAAAATEERAFPRAFAVRFREMERWDPSSFFDITWHWPSETLVPIGSLLRPRKEKVDRERFMFADLQPITIHFNGGVSRRKVNAAREYTMQLQFAHPGDVVVAKIDLKNGAVGIVPEGWENVVVTTHFAVYEPDRSRLVPEYLHRLIQTRFFKAHLWRNKVGAEGRKEVKMPFLERQLIPLPPLDVQRAIVDYWQAERAEAEAARAKVRLRQSDVLESFYTALGVIVPPAVNRPRCFAMPLSRLARWGVRPTLDRALGLDRVPNSQFPYSLLGAVASVSYGIQKSPQNRPGQHPRPYLAVANVRRGYLDLANVKTINVPDAELATYRLVL